LALGKAGEDLAEKYLCRKNYEILKRNFRSKLGEIDIIARDGKTLVFCEVKTRVSTQYGQPFEAVTPRKQATIRAVAEMYLAVAKNPPNLNGIRFDVVSILSTNEGIKIRHFENAF
jgi:putative endonuclease